MPSVEFFCSERTQLEKTHWHDTFDTIKKLGFDIHTKPKQCDISVVLQGQYVNPLPLKGKRVLFYLLDDWTKHKWEGIYGLVLEEYYDELINIEDTDLKELIEKIHQGNC